ncbi:MAG: aldehyde dehydrogenase family protein [Devosia sp.]|uniref:aldehyde dehydrogenase family protein n=1 Tax=Devosia sp. TaxID=1871048 RepID=UPI00261821C7|nr:aldehyde dehydrogenase family protein [Devosia sp.]MDB5527291.1 aldehyde dehydrogenase family protein [Devosia sp.]
MQIITRHFINGEFVQSHGSIVAEVRNPFNNVIIGRVTLGDTVDAERAVAAAKAAFPAWSQTTLEERKAWLQKLADALTDRLHDLTAACIAEFGGLTGFSAYAMSQARDFFVLAQETLKPENFEQVVNQATVTRVPLGVAALLTPWNGNPWFICGKAASALAAGCTVVIKPSELSALEAQVLMEAFHAAGLPAGVINLVNGRGEQVGNTYTRSPDVQKISFTGSTRVGKMINRDATETMKRVTLELGGKSPTVIMADADVDGAVRFALTVGLNNTGSACIAGTRILVPEHRAEEFKAAFKTRMQMLRAGDPADPATTIQPMITANHWQRVQDYIQTGIDEGAELITGGLGKPAGLEAGNFVKPTLFANVRNDMAIAQEEIFGPVLAMITYRDEAEAVAIANDIEYGLHAYIYGADLERARSIANRLQAGRVMINEMVDDPRAPFGGFKMSGFGREFGVAGMQAFTEPRAVFG